jgi:hypothetical protein
MAAMMPESRGGCQAPRRNPIEVNAMSVILTDRFMPARCIDVNSMIHWHKY